MSKIYNKIGLGYGQTRQADGYLSERLLFHLNLRQNGMYLDLGCGTGNYTVLLAQKNAKVVGLDPSIKMLNTAKSKATSVDWILGNAEKIPLEDNLLDGITAFLTVHHWSDLSKSFGEINRVLKPGKRIIIFTSTPKQMSGYWLNHYFPNMMTDSMVQMPSLETIRMHLEVNNMKFIASEKYFVKSDLIDLFLYSGKHNPNLYLDPKVRHGISSFSNLSNKVEVESGLDKLERDIENGHIQKVVQQFENDYGDYIFLIAEKEN